MRPDATSPCRLTLLRHGQSTYNAVGRYQGASDAPSLTSVGRQQARSVAEWLRGSAFNRVFVSPLRRARQTEACLRARIPDLPPAELTPLLSEIALPHWEGRRFKDVAVSDAERHRVWKLTPETFTIATGQGNVFSPFEDVTARVQRFAKLLSATCAGCSVLAITHGGVVRALLTSLLGLPGNRLHCFAQDNGAATTLTLGPNAETRLVGFNRSATPDAVRLARAVGTARPVLVLASPAPARALEMRFPFATSVDVSAGSPDTLTLPVPIGPTLVRAPLPLQEAMLARLLGLPVAHAAALNLVPNSFQLITPQSASSRAVLRVLNGRIGPNHTNAPAYHHHLTETI